MKKWTLQVILWLCSPLILLGVYGMIFTVLGYYCADVFMAWRDGKPLYNPIVKTVSSLHYIMKGR
jgi:hypothetical protein